VGKTLETAAGRFEVDYACEFREGVLSLSLDRYEGDLPRDCPELDDVASADDVITLLLGIGVPEDEARSVSENLFDEAERWALRTFEAYLVRLIEEREQSWPERFRIFNQWTRVGKDRLLRISSGVMTDDLKQGVVVVSSAAADVPLREIAHPSNWLSVEHYLTARRCGRLAIALAVGDTITIDAADGSEWIFDLPSRQLRLVSSKGHA